MGDLVWAVWLTMAVPGLILGAILGLRGGLVGVLVNAIAGTIGGIAGALAVGGIAAQLDWTALTSGPWGLVAGSLLGAALLVAALAAIRSRAR